VLGVYSVTVDHSGFKTSINSGIILQGADTIRKDVVLAVGSVSESVEVKAGAQQLEVTTPDVSHTVDEKYYRDIPIITASDVRLAESMLQIQPGYLPMKPNGDPMFHGVGATPALTAARPWRPRTSSMAPPLVTQWVINRARKVLRRQRASRR
jgi:hypothetical protein